MAHRQVHTKAARVSSSTIQKWAREGCEVLHDPRWTPFGHPKAPHLTWGRHCKAPLKVKCDVIFKCIGRRLLRFVNEHSCGTSMNLPLNDG
ncbi:hypothetical protein E2C01_080125 [Portunus trituberculatus]|uniref:Uncharacterized protein n=1 Tax=Portunus trituberculatus TaxID=210409 RepID=A0A5B7IYP8_PORTR|nr:hypothetical protein [Portunus trituberculatus]